MITNKKMSITVMAMLLSITSSLSYAAWTSVEKDACKAEITREYNSQIYYFNGTQILPSAEYDASYNAALTRCDNSVYVVFDAFSWYEDSYGNPIGYNHFATPIKPHPFYAIGTDVLVFTFGAPQATSVVMECKAPSLEYPSNIANCNGYPLQYNWTNQGASGTQYSYKLGYSYASNFTNVKPVYQCKSTIEHYYIGQQLNTFIDYYASTSPVCYNYLHSTANAGVTRGAIIGYALTSKSINYQ